MHLRQGGCHAKLSLSQLVAGYHILSFTILIMRLRNWKETVPPTIEDTLRDVHPHSLYDGFHWYAVVSTMKFAMQVQVNCGVAGNTCLGVCWRGEEQEMEAGDCDW